MVTLVTDYGSFNLPLYWDGTNGLDYRLPETVDGVAMVRFYAPAYALMLQAQARAASAGAMGFAMRFTWDDGTSAADPGAGKVRIDNATAGSATAVYVNDADANGSDRSAIFALFDDSTSAVKGIASIVKLTDPAKWMIAKVTATTDGAGFWTLTITATVASGATPFTAGDSVVLGFVPNGDRGWPNDGFRWTFSTTTTDADPGAGIIRLDNATQNIATSAFIDLADADGATQTTWLDSLDDASGTKKGRVRIAAQSDPTRFITGSLSAVTTASGYRKLVFTVLSSSGATPFVDAEALFVSFAPAGDAGDVTGPASSTSNGLVTWNGTGGAALLSTAWTIVANVMTAGGTLDMAGHALTIDFATFEQAGQHAATISTSVTGEVILADTGAPYRAYTITGDTTLLVAGPTTPGYVSGGYRVVITQDGVGGRDVTILPINELASYSADLQSTAEAGESRPWTDTNTSLDLNAAVGPDGQTTLTKLIEDAGAGNHLRDRTVTSLSPNQTLTLTAVLRDAGNSRNVEIGLFDADSGANYINVMINPATGAVVAGPTNGGLATGATVLITALANSCYRVDLTGQPNTSGTNTKVQVALASGASTSYTGDGTSGVYIGEIQVNKGTPVGIAHVGATRAGMVTWPNADEPNWAAQAAGVVTEISVPPAYDGNIHCYKIRGG